MIEKETNKTIITIEQGTCHKCGNERNCLSIMVDRSGCCNDIWVDICLKCLQAQIQKHGYQLRKINNETTEVSDTYIQNGIRIH